MTRLLARLHGPLEPAMTRADVMAAVGRRGLDTGVRRGELVRLLPGVYVAGAVANEHRVRCAAVVLWSRGALRITGESALHLYARDLPAPAVVECVGPARGGIRVPPWVRLRRREPGPWQSSPRGVACVVSEEAVVDAWHRAAPERREDLLYQALWERVAGWRAIARAASKRRRIADRRRLTAIIREFEAGARSPGEAVARRRVFVGRTFREFERQVELVVAGRRRYPDMLHRELRIVVEADGDAYHGDRRAVRNDRERDAELAAAGYVTIRFSFRDLMDRPDWCRRIVLDAIARRRRT